MTSLRVGGLLSLVGVALILWMLATPVPESESLADKPTAGSTANLLLRDLTSAPRGSSQVRDTRPEVLVRDGLSVGAKDRPQRFRRKFRELPARRDPDLEADPQFQKLMEIDAARKMALIENDDREQLKQALVAIRDPSARIGRHVLEQALLDPSAEVRLAALSEISLEMEQPPLELLAPVVEGDPDPEVRLEALEMVGESQSHEADAVIRTALNDPDPSVRMQAEDLIEDRADEASM